jgi:hypothetical protein
VCARALQKTPQLFENITVRFFLVPLGRSLLAGYLARFDYWYK